jgi:hypothetical protein
MSQSWEATVFRTPLDDQPRFVDWTDPDTKTEWWQPALVAYGGRGDTPVVIDSAGMMTIYHGDHRRGEAQAPYEPKGPAEDEFWPLTVTTDSYPPDWAHQIRPWRWMVVRVAGTLGLARAFDTMPLNVPPDCWWRLAFTFTALGFYPPLGLEWLGNRSEFATGVSVLGERNARRVKRSLVARLAAERKSLRNLSTAIESNWRP